MKYLKTFEKIVTDVPKVSYFVIDDNIRSQIKDILLDITDKGFIINYNWTPIPDFNRDCNSYIEITNYKSNNHGRYPFLKYEPFKYTEIEDVITRLGRYMEMQGYDIRITNQDQFRIEGLNLQYKIEFIKPVR